MKTIILICCLVGAAVAQGNNTGKFEVKEITPTTVEALAQAEWALSAAVDALKLSQYHVDTEKTRRDAIVSSLVSENGAFEGVCTYTSMSGSKSFRRVEIRGKYVLITEGSETCPLVTFTNANAWGEVIRALIAMLRLSDELEEG